MVVVIEEIRAATAMASDYGRFQREKIGEDSIGEWRMANGDGVVGEKKKKGAFLIHLRYADIKK